jgi:hypothetical protein
MNIEQMRSILMGKYNQSVKISKMPDKQIAAMYQRLLAKKGALDGIKPI